MTARLNRDIWLHVHAERVRAHELHRENSMEELAVEDPMRLAILGEEFGEVAREFCEARHRGEFDLDKLRTELIQVAAMAGAWADKLTPEWSP